MIWGRGYLYGRGLRARAYLGCRVSTKLGWGLHQGLHFAGQDLMADLKSEISGDLARLILGLMMPPAHYDAKQLKKAMEVGVSLSHTCARPLCTRVPVLHVPQRLPVCRFFLTGEGHFSWEGLEV